MGELLRNDSISTVFSRLEDVLPLTFRLWADRRGGLGWDDIASLAILTPLTWSLISYFWLPKKPERGHGQLFLSPQRLDGLIGEDGKREEESRDINDKLQKLRKDVVVFWGSQSGKAMRLAKQLVRELQTVYGIAAIVEDIDSYDHEHLRSVAKEKVIGFIVSTFGEGDPPDNSAGLLEELQSITKTQQSLPQLRYFVFGLGSSKYQYYNKFADDIDEHLQGAHSSRLGYVGKLDATTNSDAVWMQWKETMLQELRKSVVAREANKIRSLYEPDIKLVDLSQVGSRIPPAPLAAQLHASKSRGRTTVYAAPICYSQRLSATDARAYLHIEFDVSNTGDCLHYSTGDHIAVWPMNSDQEVQRLAALFGWNKTTLNAPIQIDSDSESFEMSSLPQGRTSRDSLLRYCLDISGSIPQESIGVLEHFAPTDRAKAFIRGLTQSESNWEKVVSSNHLTYSRLMQLADPTPGLVWPDALFSMLVQEMPHLQPRYFSISSSPLISEKRISITVGALITELPDRERFYGLTTSYLSALHQTRLEAAETHSDEPPSFCLDGPSRTLLGTKAFVHIRPSTFKPPADPSRPMIMVAAGSGIAPFLAFAQEREAYATSGKPVGQTNLFFGCRDPEKDYLYKEVWSKMEGKHDWFSVATAFSRAGKREYVQDKIASAKEEVLRLLLEGDGCLYMCGSVGMANGVKDVLSNALRERGWTNEKVSAWMETMKHEKRIQEDVWA